jgi:hypothetical protein
MNPSLFDALKEPLRKGSKLLSAFRRIFMRPFLARFADIFNVEIPHEKTVVQG